MSKANKALISLLALGLALSCGPAVIVTVGGGSGGGGGGGNTFQPPPPFDAFLSVTKNVAGTGTGLVTSNVGGIVCGNSCPGATSAAISTTTTNPTAVLLTATPSPGSAFTGWTGDVTQLTSPVAVFMSGDKQVTARFDVTINTTLTVTRSGTGSGTVTSDIGGINCPGSCTSGSIVSNVVNPAMVTLTATSLPGSTFVGWSGDVVGATSPVVVAMNASKQVNALFDIVSAAQFAPQEIHPLAQLSGNPKFVIHGDFDENGKPDFAIANETGSTVSILRNSTGAVTEFSAGTSPVALATGDLNRDGHLDLAAASSDNVSILIGNGQGSFSAPSSFPAGSAPRSVAIGDFDTDGKLDLVLVNGTTAEVQFLRNTTALPATLSFALPVSSLAGVTPIFVTSRDLDGDGKLDLAVANRNVNKVTILKGSGTGTFAFATESNVGTQPLCVAVGDFNKDGRPDLAVANNADVSILLNTTVPPASLTFAAAPSPAAGLRPIFIAIADINHDGISDLVVTNQNGTANNDVSVLLGFGDGTFRQATNFTAEAAPSCVAIGDYDRDGDPDLAVTNANSFSLSILLNTTPITPSGTFGPINKISLGTGFGTRGVSVADLNADGRLDLAVVNRNNGTVTTLLGTGTGSFAPAATIPAGNNAFFLAIGDLTGDGKLDLAVSNELNPAGTISVLTSTTVPQSSPLSFTSPVAFSAGLNPRRVAIGDFNADGKPDLVVPNHSGQNVSVLLGNGSGVFGTAIKKQVLTNPRSVAIGDFNADGKLDLAVANHGGTSLSILIGIGDGTFSTGVLLPIGLNQEFVAAGDFDRDGKLDLAVARQEANQIAILIGDGMGGFGTGQVILDSGDDFPFALAVADLNVDGILDLAVANDGNTTPGGSAVMFGVGDGSFLQAIPVHFPLGSKPKSIAIGDLNGDGRLDLAVGNEGNESISILLSN